MASKASSAVHKNDDIVVLTWNICFGCITHNPKDFTGKIVADQCIAKSTNPATHFPCRDNLINFITQMPRIHKFDEYDFIGLQETSGWQNIIRDPRMQSLLITGGGYLNYV